LVLAYLPQSMKASLVANSNNPPQGVPIGVAPPPIGGSALVQTTTLSALVQTGTLSALVQTV